MDWIMIWQEETEVQISMTSIFTHTCTQYGIEFQIRCYTGSFLLIWARECLPCWMKALVSGALLSMSIDPSLSLGQLFFFYLLLVLIIFKTIFKAFCGTRTMWNMFPREKENWFPISSQYIVVLHFTATQHDSTEMAAGRITALCRKRDHINLVTSLLVSQHSVKVILWIEAVL